MAVDAVVVDTDSQGGGVQRSETSNSDDFAKNLIRAGVGPVRHQRPQPAGRRLLRPDDLRTPGGVAVFFAVLGHLTGPNPRSRSFARICAIGESARSVREIGRLPKIRTPGAQTGRCARRRATITACPVSRDTPISRSRRRIARSRNRRRSRRCTSVVRTTTQSRRSQRSQSSTHDVHGAVIVKHAVAQPSHQLGQVGSGGSRQHRTGVPQVSRSVPRPCPQSAHSRR